MQALKPSAILFVALMAACGNDAHVTIPNEQIIGTYRTTEWTIPGPADGGIDIHAGGGFIEAKLIADYRMTGRVVAPTGVLASQGNVDETVSGTYALKGDTVDFDAEFFPDYARWVPAENKIETFEVPRRGRPYKIIWVKQ